MRSIIAAAAAIAIVAVAAAVACRPAEGTLELRWRLPAGATAGLTEIRLAPEWAGANRGPLRDVDWTRVPLAATDVTLPAEGDGRLVIARGTLPAGRWDRVFIASPVVTGVRPDGTQVDLTSHIEPIARGFDLDAGARVTVDIELIVLPVPAFKGRGWEVFVKGAVVSSQ